MSNNEQSIIQLPEYMPDDPNRWFYKVENAFKNTFVKSEEIKFKSVINALTSHKDEIPENINNTILSLTENEFHVDNYQKLIGALKENEPKPILQNEQKIFFVWTIKHAKNLLSENKNSTIFYSNSFPESFTFLQFSLRAVTYYNKKYFALFLHLNTFDENQFGNSIKIFFKFKIYNGSKKYLSSNISKIFVANNCFGFENLITMEKLINLNCNVLEIFCEIQLNNANKNFSTDFLLPIHSSIIAPKVIQSFSSKIIIKNFVKNYFATENSVVESETFFNNNFSIVLLKEKDEFQKNTGYISLCLKYFLIKTLKIFWKVSILLINNESFITSEGNCNFNSTSCAIGSKKFILEKDLFDYNNNLLLNDALTFYVEIYIFSQQISTSPSSKIKSIATTKNVIKLDADSTALENLFINLTSDKFSSKSVINIEYKKLTTLFEVKIDKKVIWNISMWWKNEISGRSCAQSVVDEINNSFSIAAKKTAKVAGIGAAFGAVRNPVSLAVGSVLGDIVRTNSSLFSTKDFNTTVVPPHHTTIVNQLSSKIFDLSPDEALKKAFTYFSLIENASSSEIKNAYKQRLKNYHNKNEDLLNFAEIQSNIAIIIVSKVN